MRRTLKIIACIILAFVLWEGVSIWLEGGPKRFSQGIRTLLIQRAEERFSLLTHGCITAVEEEKIWKISMSLGCEEKKSLEEGRKLIVELTNDFRNLLREHKEYHKKLKNAPDALETLQLTIFFGQEEPLSEREGFFFVGNYQGKIRYAMYDPNDPSRYSSKTFLRESFEEAECILAKERAAAANTKNALNTK